MAANVPRLLGIPQVSTTVPNLQDAIRFYEGDLGLRLIFKTPAMALFACGATRLMVATPDENPTKQQTFLYFQVDDIAATQTSLTAKGVRFQGTPHTVGQFENREVWLATFFDGAGTLHHLISEVPVRATPAAAAPRSPA
ncbi:MAG TPA: VOC family protein [Candidatus Thermoplasmatota archaeon]|nr:VOC family protein [Candidatus Thermoplasmatota archaeon]